MNIMNNLSSTLCRRGSLRELITNVSVYSGLSDVAAEGGVASLIIKRWATKKAAGSSKNGRDSNPKNLGVKKFGGEPLIYASSQASRALVRCKLSTWMDSEIIVSFTHDRYYIYNAYI
ncbi:hypothetical protein MKW94_000165 [Papaver nudicaule]|uniref:Uncharacterized protein n=1 Tax=Papaver nudicaule TaxID=74823 RepID=A0AA41SGV4_PAPNU|nr:hypothetical protein [Papaver nudicaule]